MCSAVKSAAGSQTCIGSACLCGINPLVASNIAFSTVPPAIKRRGERGAFVPRIECQTRAPLLLPPPGWSGGGAFLRLEAHYSPPFHPSLGLGREGGFFALGSSPLRPLQTCDDQQWRQAVLVIVKGTPLAWNWKPAPLVPACDRVERTGSGTSRDSSENQ